MIRVLTKFQVNLVIPKNNTYGYISTKRAGIWIHNTQTDHAEGHAYRLNFRCTNNMAEYEALLLGLKLIRDLGATKDSILGDSDLIIQQMEGNFVTNDNRLRAYRRAAIDILNTFSESQLTKNLKKPQFTCT